MLEEKARSRDRDQWRQLTSRILRPSTADFSCISQFISIDPSIIFFTRFQFMVQLNQYLSRPYVRDLPHGSNERMKRHVFLINRRLNIRNGFLFQKRLNTWTQKMWTTVCEAFSVLSAASHLVTLEWFCRALGTEPNPGRIADAKPPVTFCFCRFSLFSSLLFCQFSHSVLCMVCPCFLEIWDLSCD